MLFSSRRIIFSITYNVSLFFMLMVGIQNSKYETRVSLFRMKSAELPVSFVVGVSFLAGSISGIFIPGYFISKK